MKDLSIIIVTYNSTDYIEKCLQSVFTAAETLNFQIIVVDNNSSDDTLAKVKKFKTINIIDNKENVGFAQACNQGLKVSKSEFLLLLNPDTLLDKVTIVKALNFIQAKENIGLVGGRLQNPDGSLQYSAGRFPTVFNIAFDKIPILNKLLPVYFERKKSFYKKICYPDWLTAAFLLIRRRVIDQIGLFDPIYFMYMEEVDFCYRARQAGWLTAYYPETKVIHYDLGKSRERRYNKFINQRKGLLNFFKKFYSPEKLKLAKALLRFELRFKRLPGNDQSAKYKSLL